MKLIIVRHGQTEENRRGIVQGQKRGHLSELGKEQVLNVALELSKVNLDAIYSSDLKRCVDTVIPIAKYHKNTDVIYSKQLEEIKIGGFGLVPLWFPPQLANSALNIAIRLNFKSPGGESWKSLKNRERIFLNDLYSTHQNETVLIVSHGISIRAMLVLLSSKSIAKKLIKKEVPNCSINYLEMNHKLN